MPAALLALLLAEVGARDTTDGHLGQFFAELPESLGLALVAGERGAVPASDTSMHSHGARHSGQPGD